MSQSDPFGPDKFDSYQQPEATVAPPERQGPGCLFWGCLISGILLLVTVILVIVLVVFARNWAIGKLDEFTEPNPVELPEIQLAEEERQQVVDRWEAFKTSLDEGKADEISFDSAELNVVAQHIEPEAEGKVHFEIEGDKLRGQVSVPVEELGKKLLATDQLDGRYLNASGTFDVFLRNGALVLQMQEAEVKGEAIPDEIMDQFRGQNLAENMNSNPDQRKMFENFKSIEVKDGRVYFTSGGTSPDESAEGDETPEGDEVTEPAGGDEPSEPTNVIEPTPESETDDEPEPADEPEPTDTPEEPEPVR